LPANSTPSATGTALSPSALTADTGMEDT